MVVSGTNLPPILCVSSSDASADWQQNINGLNSNFGNANDLCDLSSAIHARGMVSQQGPPL